MSAVATIAVPTTASTRAAAALGRAARVQRILGSFATRATLEGLPAEISAAIADLRALEPQVRDLRAAAGLPRNPPKTKKEEAS